jgi:hypothetical protein
MGEEPLTNDQAEDDLDEPWYPSPKLRGIFRAGTIAVVLTGVLSGASSLAALAQGRQPGFTLAHGLAWAALLPALWVVGAYVSLGEEAGRPALGKSALALFGAGVVLQLYELARLKLFPAGGQVALWVLFAIGLIALPILPFLSDDEQEKPAAELPPWAEEAPAEAAGPAPQATETEPPASSKAAAGAAGALGALGLALVGMLKVFGKGFGKLFFFRGLINVFRLKWDWVTIAGGAALVAAGTFLVWFAILKIRLRRQLGGVAAFVGWAELLGFALALALLAELMVQLGAAGGQPGLNANELAALEQKFRHDAAMLELGANMLWASLTVCLFASLRQRRDPEADAGWEV